MLGLAGLSRYDAAISPYLLRLSIGLEDCADLQSDLQRSILATRDMPDEAAAL
jgi:cystathionine beta-lyase/cystathionine gamma-synthase